MSAFIRPVSLLTIPAVAVLLLAGCAQPATRVVLLPQDDGSRSAVAVMNKNGGSRQRVLSEPYQEATIAAGANRAPQVKRTDAESVRAKYGTLLDLRPPKPQQFVLYFELGDTMLTEQSQDELKRALQVVKEFPGADITVTGYTDTVGPQAQNDVLSLQRAGEVRELLIKDGFPPARIEAVGRGERQLRVPTPDETPEPRNRCVVIEVR